MWRKDRKDNLEKEGVFGFKLIEDSCLVGSPQLAVGWITNFGR
jgi:hypothetical protein